MSVRGSLQKGRKGIFVTAAALSTLTMIGTAPAYAAYGDHNWAGFNDAPGVFLTGSQCQIMRQNTPQMNSPNTGDDSTTWVMNNDTSGLQHYAQTGFMECDYQPGSVYYFFEENDGTTDIQLFTNGKNQLNGWNPSGAVGPATGVYHTYAVNEVSIPGGGWQWTGTVDGLYGNVFFANENSWTSNRIFVAEELYDSVDNRFFGTVASPTYFYRPQYISGGLTYDWSNPLAVVTNPSVGNASWTPSAATMLAWDPRT